MSGAMAASRKSESDFFLLLMISNLMCDLCKQSALLFLRSAVEVSLLISSRTFCGPGRRSTESISPKRKNKEKTNPPPPLPPKKKQFSRQQKQKKKMKMLQMFAGYLAADRASSSLSYFIFPPTKKRFLSACGRGRCDAFAGQAVAQEKKAFKGDRVSAQRASSCRRTSGGRGGIKYGLSTDPSTLTVPPSGLQVQGGRGGQTVEIRESSKKKRKNPSMSFCTIRHINKLFISPSPLV